MSCPVENGTFGGDWSREIEKESSVAIDGHFAEAKSSGNLRDGVDQFTLMKGSSLPGPAKLKVRGMHLGEILFSLS